MQQLSPLDARFLRLESPTMTGHVGRLLTLEAPGESAAALSLDAFRDRWATRLHRVPGLRRRLATVPLGLGAPYWVDDPGFDLEYHVRETVLPFPGTPEQIAECISRLHARPLDRARPLWEVYLVQVAGEESRAVYAKFHHSLIDEASGADILTAILDGTDAAADTGSLPSRWQAESPPSPAALLARGAATTAVSAVRAGASIPESLPRLSDVPGVARLPGIQLASGLVDAMVTLAGRRIRGAQPEDQELVPPRTPFNGALTPHRRFGYGSVPREHVGAAQQAWGMTVEGVVAAMATTALRRWLLDHDALPSGPLVAALPRPWLADIGAVVVQLPTQVTQPGDRVQQLAASFPKATESRSDAPVAELPAGLADRARFRHAARPGPPVNLFVSYAAGPRAGRSMAGRRVAGCFPVSTVSDRTGGLDIAVIGYDGGLDIGVLGCRELVPDVGRLLDYLRDSL